MPARDKYHNVVRNALVKDGWTVYAAPEDVLKDTFQQPSGRLMISKQ